MHNRESYSTRKIRHTRKVVFLMGVIPIIATILIGTVFYFTTNYLNKIKANVILSNNFEGGLGWSTQRVSADRLKIVTKTDNNVGAPQGSNMARFELRQGDNPLAQWCCQGTNRVEFTTSTNEQKGQDRWYSWYQMFDTTFPSYDTYPTSQNQGWQIFAQWHGNDSLSPAMAWFAAKDNIVLARGNGNSYNELWRGPMNRGQWINIKMHMVWGDSGTVVLWINGSKVYEKSGIDNVTNPPLYFKTGMYRPQSLSAKSITYLDDFKMGTTEADVGTVTQPPVTPTDVCPNITGAQASIPTGMIKDSSGNCVTPPPVTPTDVCPNITGAQASIPTGKIKDASGNCVDPPPPVITQSPYGGSARSIPGTIQAEDFDEGGEGVSFHDGDTANNGGKYRTTSAVDIESATGGGYDVGWNNPGEWREHTVNVQDGTYNITARVGSTLTGGQLVLKMDNTAFGAINIPNTGGWQTYQNVTLNNIKLTAGSNKILRFETAGNSYTIDSIIFTKLTTPPPVVPNPPTTPVTPNPPSNPSTKPLVTVPGASNNAPVAIPTTIKPNSQGEYIADFNNDGLNDTAIDSNNDGLIDPNTEVIVDGSDDTDTAPDLSDGATTSLLSGRLRAGMVIFVIIQTIALSATTVYILNKKYVFLPKIINPVRSYSSKYIDIVLQKLMIKK